MARLGEFFKIVGLILIFPFALLAMVFTEQGVRGPKGPPPGMKKPSPPPPPPPKK